MYRKKGSLPYLAERLRVLRRSADMTQQELADMLHVERCTYAFYETGKSRPDLNLILRIAHIYKIKADDLIDPESPIFNTAVGEGPFPPALTESLLLSKRDKNEKEMLGYFRQMTQEQQETILQAMIKTLAPSENKDNV